MNGVGWRAAMETALYGPDGFFVREAEGPGGHFRTSVHASPLFAGAVARLIGRVDGALGHPPVLDVVDVGAGRGELLAALLDALAGAEGSAYAAEGAARGAALDDEACGQTAESEACGRAAENVAPGRYVSAHPVHGVGEAVAAGDEMRKSLVGRVRLTAVEKAARPAGLDARIAWRDQVPDHVTGLLLATEWLDNVPLEVAEVDSDGVLRQVLVEPGTGVEQLGPPLDDRDRRWCEQWWPATDGERVEVGVTRDSAWREAVGRLRNGVAVAVDYGHRKGERPRHGTLTGFRGGRQVTPVPDGSCDVTAHVAMDAVAVAGGHPYTLIRQRDALRALGVDGARPPLDLARSDPAAYLRALSSAGAAAELTDRDGLGGHWWLVQSVGLDEDARGTMLG